MKIKRNIDLSRYSTMKIGKTANFFVVVKSEENLIEALKFAKENKLEVQILGEGSNTIFINDFSGIIIKNEIKGIEISKKKDYAEITAGAGENWDGFVRKMVRAGLHGLENLSLIPGTVGAAPIQNIGAYGEEVGDKISKVVAIHRKTLKKVNFTRARCKFAYRDSFFKTKEGQNYCITKVVFKLGKKRKVNIEYPDLKEYFAGKKKVSVKNVREAVIKIRRKKLPDPKRIGNVGSFFKNPIVNEKERNYLIKNYPEAKIYELGRKKYKVSAAWLIDNICKMKGKVVGGVSVHEKQALVLVNKNNATVRDLIYLKNKIKKIIKTKTKIDLEEEVKLI